MPSPTKPTTNLTREELEDQLVAILIDKLHINHPDGVVVESKDIYAAMHHHGTPLIDTYTQAKEREAKIERSYRCRELIEANANSSEDAEWYGDIVLLDVDDLLDEINGEPSESVKGKMQIAKGFGLRCKKGIHLLELQGCIKCKKEAKKRKPENL